MDTTRFKRILSAFVGSDDQLEIKGGTLVVQLGNELIDARLSQKDGSLLVTEGGVIHRAERWLVHRVALLDQLAERILSHTPEVGTFVTPKGELLERINDAPNDDAAVVDDGLSALAGSLERRPGGTCSVLYLTSDAGEGKTTLISCLARQQAKKFRARDVDWLLVPISLGGRPFLRFEDVVVAALMNQLRFQRLYFDAFVELVRLGVLIPALDGFEEVFVETAEGDAVSSLGTLIRQLGGEGTLLIAARKAYFEYKRLETQARLLDALPGTDVAFARLKLQRWGRDQFLHYCQLSGLTSGEALYSEAVARVGADHSLLTRAVLVRRLVDIAKEEEDLSFVSRLEPESDTFFLQFIDTILQREAHAKWIDKLNDPPQPLLSVEEHHKLLSYIAEEMWISKTGALSGDLLDSLAEIFCDTFGKTPIVTRQVRERLKQHALITATTTGRKEYSFDHENFRDFFLGEQLGRHLLALQASDLRKLMRADLLQGWTLDVAASVIREANADLAPIVKAAVEVAQSEGPSSYVRENAGGLLVRLLNHATDSAVLEHLAFPVDALQNKAFQGVLFKHCYFRHTSLAGTSLLGCDFQDCEFERLELHQSTHIRNSLLGGTTLVRTLSLPRGEDLTDIYDPRRISNLLALAGFGQSPASAQFDLTLDQAEDRRLTIMEKALQAFHRSTQVSVGTFRLRLSIHASQFFDEILPELEAVGVLEKVTTGPAAHDRYKLGMPLRIIGEAIANSERSYERCLQSIRAHSVRPSGTTQTR